MLKKIQHTLLLRYPLLWNMRIIPVLGIVLLLNIIYFVAGYLSGNIDFSEYNNIYRYDDTETIAVVFAVFTSILVLTGWLYFYFRNNAFKSFYPIGKNHLFAEWLLCMVICVANFAYSVSFFFGLDTGKKSYFSEAEFSRRIDIISMASVFAQGGMKDDGLYYIIQGGREVERRRDYTTFKGKRYPLDSYVNKSHTRFSYQFNLKDSLNDLRVKSWLADGRKDSLVWLMREFEAIARSHKAKSNISPEKWADLVYHPKDFREKTIVGREEMFSDYLDRSTMEEDVINQSVIEDTLSNIVKIVGDTRYVYPRNYVPLRQLENGYEQISDTYTNPSASVFACMTFLICGVITSLLIFSFRVTSARSWIVTLISFGSLALVSSILVIVANNLLRHFQLTVYFGFWLIIVIGCLIYFYSKTEKKGLGMAALNLLLWLLPFVLPVLHVIAKEILMGARYQNGFIGYEEKSCYEMWVDANVVSFILICLAAFIIFMFFFTRSIRRWKGLAEA